MLPAALLIVAAILFAIAFFGVPTGRYALVAGGLFFVALADILRLGVL
jgi:NADH:ubiquinone oxidoreductase subunit K